MAHDQNVIALFRFLLRYFYVEKPSVCYSAAVWHKNNASLTQTFCLQGGNASIIEIIWFPLPPLDIRGLRLGRMQLCSVIELSK